MKMMNSLYIAIVGLRDQDTVDSDVFDQRTRALLHKHEERPKNGLIIPSRRESPYSSSLQERLSFDRLACAIGGGRPETTRALGHKQWPACVAGFAVLLFVSGRAFCQLLETLGHRHTPRTGRHHWRRTSDYRFLTRTHSRRTSDVWKKGQKSSNFGQFSSTFVGLRA